MEKVGAAGACAPAAAVPVLGVHLNLHVVPGGVVRRRPERHAEVPDPHPLDGRQGADPILRRVDLQPDGHRHVQGDQDGIAQLAADGDHALQLGAGGGGCCGGGHVVVS